MVSRVTMLASEAASSWFSTSSKEDVEEEMPEVQLARRHLLVSLILGSLSSSLIGHWPEVQAASWGLPHPMANVDGLPVLTVEEEKPAGSDTDTSPIFSVTSTLCSWVTTHAESKDLRRAAALLSILSIFSEDSSSFLWSFWPGRASQVLCISARIRAIGWICSGIGIELLTATDGARTSISAFSPPDQAFNRSLLSFSFMIPSFSEAISS